MYTVRLCGNIEDNRQAGIEDETACLGAEFVLGREGN